MKKIKPILKDSYLAFIKNSAGAKSWRSLYASVGGRKEDILKGGEFSCAYFASSILLIFGLTKNVHATISGTIKDMKASGWREIEKPKPGAVLLWEKQKQGKGEPHFHLGFAINKNQAISNRWEHKCPIIHHITYGIKNKKPVRKIEKIFWHTKLDS
jgi:hypothetical protein